MKRTLIVISIAAMLVFGVAGTAFAAGINHSGQDQLGKLGAPDANAEATSQAAIYKAWDKTLNGNKQTDASLPDFAGNSPHGNYTTSTVKCVVCHAVHYAAPGNATVASGKQTADTLLRMRADQACVFCHATAGMAVNGRPVYDGLGGALTDNGNTGGATNTGHITGKNCSYCHTSVHGANGDNSVAALNGYLLKNMAASNVASTGATTNNMLDAITAIDHAAVNQGFAAGSALGYTIGAFATNNDENVREQAVGVFCAECHNGAYATNAAGASVNVLQADSANPALYSGHRVGVNVTATPDWNAAGDKSSGVQKNITVAWAPASSCKSCHDARDKYDNEAFPHSWGGTKMWLKSAAYAGAETTALPYGKADGSAYDANSPQLEDGVCLKCHVASDGTNGVGKSF